MSCLATETDQVPKSQVNWNREIFCYNWWHYTMFVKRKGTCERNIFCINAFDFFLRVITVIYIKPLVLYDLVGLNHPVMRNVTCNCYVALNLKVTDSSGLNTFPLTCKLSYSVVEKTFSQTLNCLYLWFHFVNT